MITKILTIILLLFTTGCSQTLENELTGELEDSHVEILPNEEDSNFELEDLEPEIAYNEYYELLLSYVFIDVTNLSKIYLPQVINNEIITWKNNGSIVSYITGSNITYELEAFIGSQSKIFHITFKNNLVDEIFQQDLLFKYIFITNSKKLGTSMSPNKIIFHNTANSAPALNEVLYLNSVYNTNTTSFHYAVDDIGIYQAIPNNIYAHHAGNLTVNKESIGVEIAKSLSSNIEEKNQAILNAQKLIRLLQMKYNINDVLPHYDITGKHCPHDIFDRYSINTFYKELNLLHTAIL